MSKEDFRGAVRPNDDFMAVTSNAAIVPGWSRMGQPSRRRSHVDGPSHEGDRRAATDAARYDFRLASMIKPITVWRR